MSNKLSFSKLVFWATIVGSVYRDNFMPDPNMEIYAGFAAGMLASLVIYVIFEDWNK